MLSFLMAGAGLYATQTTGLALAADLAPEARRPQVVGWMFVALFCGMILSALAFRFALQPYGPLRLVKVIQSAAVMVAVLNGAAVWRQEPFGVVAVPRARSLSFRQALAPLCGRPEARRTLLMLALGSAAFGLQEVLVEPFGGQVLHMSVASTTALTGLVGAGSLAGFGAGLFGVAALNAVLALSRDGASGLALGVWGAVQALAAGLAVAGGGALRALLSRLVEAGRLGSGLQPTEVGYLVMYHAAIALLFAALAVLGPLASYRRAGIALAVMPASFPGVHA